MSTFMREASVEETVEEEIIELVRRDVVGPRSSDRSAEGNDIGSLLQRTSVSAVQEIDHLINELQISANVSMLRARGSNERFSNTRPSTSSC